MSDSYDMKQAQSLKQGLEVASVMGVNYGLAQSVWSILPKVGQGIEKYPLLTEMGGDGDCKYRVSAVSGQTL
ncbi:hypothetical protein IFE17_10085 [Actinobacillus sp. GY-402]|nr:hypothetical protein IFE17_10085 [Actinobacillus sp. GY-402]